MRRWTVMSIKNDLLRRTILVVCAPLIFLIEFGWYTLTKVWKFPAIFAFAMRAAWAGEERFNRYLCEELVKYLGFATNTEELMDQVLNNPPKEETFN